MAGPTRARTAADACPGALRPHLAADGAMVRLRLVGGVAAVPLPGRAGRSGGPARRRRAAPDVARQRAAARAPAGRPGPGSGCRAGDPACRAAPVAQPRAGPQRPRLAGHRPARGAGRPRRNRRTSWTGCSARTASWPRCPDASCSRWTTAPATWSGWARTWRGGRSRGQRTTSDPSRWARSWSRATTAGSGSPCAERCPPARRRAGVRRPPGAGRALGRGRGLADRRACRRRRASASLVRQAEPSATTADAGRPCRRPAPGCPASACWTSVTAGARSPPSCRSGRLSTAAARVMAWSAAGGPPGGVVLTPWREVLVPDLSASGARQLVRSCPGSAWT